MSKKLMTEEEKRRLDLFAAHYASGMSGPVAYEMAGYEPHPVNYYKLLGRPYVQSRLAEAQKAAIQKSSVSLAWVLDRQKEVIRKSIAMNELKEANKGLENIMKYCKELLMLTHSDSDADLDEMTLEELENTAIELMRERGRLDERIGH